MLLRTKATLIRWLNQKVAGGLEIDFDIKIRGLDFHLTPVFIVVAGRGFEPLTFGL